MKDIKEKYDKKKYKREEELAMAKEELRVQSELVAGLEKLQDEQR